MDKRKAVSLVIPAYNEESRIFDLIVASKPFADEIIVVDDCSLDDTATVARRAGGTVLSQATNRGYIQAIKKGIQAASGEVIVLMDADGEFSPDEIPKLVAPVIDGRADMVQGQRESEPRISEKVINWFSSFAHQVGDSGTGFRAIQSDLAKGLEINGACICGVLSLEVLSKAGRIDDIPVTLKHVRKPRKIAWFHLRQLWYIAPWVLKKSDSK